MSQFWKKVTWQNSQIICLYLFKYMKERSWNIYFVLHLFMLQLGKLFKSLDKWDLSNWNHAQDIFLLVPWSNLSNMQLWQIVSLTIIWSLLNFLVDLSVNKVAFTYYSSKKYKNTCPVTFVIHSKLMVT